MKTRGLVWGLVGFAIAVAAGSAPAVVRARLCAQAQEEVAPVAPESDARRLQSVS